jgi:hypothetical protein
LCSNGRTPTTRPSSTLAKKAPQWEWLRTQCAVMRDARSFLVGRSSRILRPFRLCRKAGAKRRARQTSGVPRSRARPPIEQTLARDSHNEQRIRNHTLLLQIGSIRDDPGRHDEGEVAGIESRIFADDRPGDRPTCAETPLSRTCPAIAVLSRSVRCIHRRVSHAIPMRAGGLEQSRTRSQVLHEIYDFSQR